MATTSSDRSPRHHPDDHRPDDHRAVAWSRQLAAAHDTLRDRLDRIRAGLGTDGPGRAADGAPAGRRGAADDDLLIHCLAFCAALGAHHVGEDTGLFAELRQSRPDLAPTLAALVHDHGLIASVLTAVRDLATEAAHAGVDRRAAIARELDGLAAIMASHFRYEERTLAAALDQADTGRADADWHADVFGPVSS